MSVHVLANLISMPYFSKFSFVYSACSHCLAGMEKKTGSALAEGDIDRMRSAIQALVQHTGPLGTCMDFIQEDVGLMSAELHKWEEECRK